MGGAAMYFFNARTDMRIGHADMDMALYYYRQISGRAVGRGVAVLCRML